MSVRVVPAGVTPAEVPSRIAIDDLADTSFADLLTELGIRAWYVYGDGPWRCRSLAAGP